MKRSFEEHITRGHPILFGLILLFTLIELIQTGVLVGDYNNSDYPDNSIRDRTRFLLFASMWTFVLSIVYLVGFMQAAGSFLFSIASHTAFLFLTWVFWLAGSAALASALGGSPLDCSNVTFAHCSLLRSAEAFGWILFILSSVALFAVFWIAARSARRGDGFGGALVV